MINSRTKGANGEREYAMVLRQSGFMGAHRDGQQGYGGSAESPDVGGLPGWHVEVKRTETGSSKIYDWLNQALKDAEGSGKRSVVAHRRNHSPWIIIMLASDFHELVRDDPEEKEQLIERLIERLLWLRNHYDLGDPRVKKGVLKVVDDTINKFLGSHNGTNR